MDLLWIYENNNSVQLSPVEGHIFSHVTIQNVRKRIIQIHLERIDYMNRFTSVPDEYYLSN